MNTLITLAMLYIPIVAACALADAVAWCMKKAVRGSNPDTASKENILFKLYNESEEMSMDGYERAQWEYDNAESERHTFQAAQIAARCVDELRSLAYEAHNPGDSLNILGTAHDIEKSVKELLS